MIPRGKEPLTENGTEADVFICTVEVWFDSVLVDGMMEVLSTASESSPLSYLPALFSVKQSFFSFSLW